MQGEKTIKENWNNNTRNNTKYYIKGMVSIRNCLNSEENNTYIWSTQWLVSWFFCIANESAFDSWLDKNFIQKTLFQYTHSKQLDTAGRKHFFFLFETPVVGKVEYGDNKFTHPFLWRSEYGKTFLQVIELLNFSLFHSRFLFFFKSL